jgi:hypothetical protein
LVYPYLYTFHFIFRRILQMAYKFQFGASRLSGSLTQEGTINVLDDSGTTQATVTNAGVVSGSGALQGASVAVDGGVTAGGQVQGGTVVGTTSVSGAAVQVPKDGLAIDGTNVTTTATELNLLDTAVAGTVVNSKAVIYGSSGEVHGGVISGSGALQGASVAVDGAISGASIEVGGGGAITDLAGTGLEVNSSALRVALSGALTFDGDKVGITGSIAGNGLAAEGGVDATSTLSVSVVANGGLTNNANSTGQMGLDLNGLQDTAIDVAADSFAFIDAGSSNITRKESIADLAIAMAGSGIGPDAGTFILDLNELSAAVVDVANDSIAIVDSDDSNGSKKESIVDFVSAIAGSGLTAASGQLSTDGASVASKADGDTLATGVNYFADLSSNATLAMPSGSVGDRVTVKAKNLTSGANIIINQSGSAAIDGETSIRIESPFGAVTMVYVTDDDWRII